MPSPTMWFPLLPCLVKAGGGGGGTVWGGEGGGCRGLWVFVYHLRPNTPIN